MLPDLANLAAGRSFIGGINYLVFRHKILMKLIIILVEGNFCLVPNSYLDYLLVFVAFFFILMTSH